MKTINHKESYSSVKIRSELNTELYKYLFKQSLNKSNITFSNSLLDNLLKQKHFEIQIETQEFGFGDITTVMFFINHKKQLAYYIKLEQTTLNPNEHININLDRNTSLTIIRSITKC
jgi:hypothetical protein